jgi:hypothetical protein
MKVLKSEKSTSADHEWLNYSIPSVPINGAFDGVTGVFPDSSERSSRATSLTSSDSFNPLGYSSCCLIPTIQRSTFTADLFFNIQPLIAAQSSFRVGSPSAQCNAPRSPSPPLLHDRCHALPTHVVRPKRTQAADRPVPLPPPASRCPRGVSRPLSGARGSPRLRQHRPLGLNEADGAQCGTRQVMDSAPGDGRLGGSVVAMLIWE